MPLLYKGLRYTVIALGVFLDYHKRAISIMYLKDLTYKVVNELTPLSLKEINLVSVNALNVIGKFRQ